jgi:hypothetical protein
MAAPPSRPSARRWLTDARCVTVRPQSIERIGDRPVPAGHSMARGPKVILATLFIDEGVLGGSSPLELEIGVFNIPVEPADHVEFWPPEVDDIHPTARPP